MKVIFDPIGIAAGLIAGLIAKKGFEQIWSAIDDEEPPAPDNRDARLAKLAIALILEGATFRLVKGLVERGARAGFASATGVWPGEEKHPAR